MCVPKVSIAGDNRFQHLVCVRLPKDLQAGLGIDGWFRHGKEETEKLEVWVKELSNLIKRLTQLNQAI